MSNFWERFMSRKRRGIEHWLRTLTQSTYDIQRLVDQRKELESMASQNLTDLQNAAAALGESVTNVETYVNGLKASADDQALPAVTAQLTAAKATLDGLIPPPPPPLTVGPASLSGTVGAAISDTLTVSGGTAPYTASSSLADLTPVVSGAVVTVAGTPSAAETGNITIKDAAGATVEVAVTIS